MLLYSRVAFGALLLCLACRTDDVTIRRGLPVTPSSTVVRVTVADTASIAIRGAASVTRWRSADSTLVQIDSLTIDNASARIRAVGVGSTAVIASTTLADGPVVTSVVPVVVIDGVPSPSAAIVTDSLSYTAVRLGTLATESYSVRVIARFTNRTSDPVYVSTCGPRDTQPAYFVANVDRSNEGFGSIFSRVLACVGHEAQPSVAAGATRVDTLMLTGPNARQNGVVLGAYNARLRVTYSVAACPGLTCGLLPPLMSNVFAVRVPR